MDISLIVSWSFNSLSCNNYPIGMQKDIICEIESSNSRFRVKSKEYVGLRDTQLKRRDHDLQT